MAPPRIRARFPPSNLAPFCERGRRFRASITALEEFLWGMSDLEAPSSPRSALRTPREGSLAVRSEAPSRASRAPGCQSVAGRPAMPVRGVARGPFRERRPLGLELLDSIAGTHAL